MASIGPSGYFAGLLSSVFEPRHPARDIRDSRSIIEQSRALLAARGDTAILRLARSILATYADLTQEGRQGFFRFLADDLDVDPAAVGALAAAYAQDPSAKALAALSSASEPPRQELFRRLNYAEGATADLVAMRQYLLREIPDNPDFAKIDLDMVHLFLSWFNRGFLVLRRVDWSTPADILEKIIAYEAVHQINDWDDLRRRTQPADRRCYAYFHPRMPEDPLIFVEIALTKDIPTSIQAVLSEERDPDAVEGLKTAVFYSISNCQPGLQGISFGEALIKRVVADLSKELPDLKTFVTLSPIPGFRRWLEGGGRVPERSQKEIRVAAEAGTGEDRVAELAAYYLMRAKRPDKQPSDPVARFHLSNGARIHNVLAGADLSENGIAQAFGAMVNYRYDLPDLEVNSDAFANQSKVAVSRRVQLLCRQGASLLKKWAAD